MFHWHLGNKISTSRRDGQSNKFPHWRHVNSWECNPLQPDVQYGLKIMAPAVALRCLCQSSRMKSTVTRIYQLVLDRIFQDYRFSYVYDLEHMITYGANQKETLCGALYWKVKKVDHLRRKWKEIKSQLFSGVLIPHFITLINKPQSDPRLEI